jgi:hypothetical protein
VVVAGAFGYVGTLKRKRRYARELRALEPKISCYFTAMGYPNFGLRITGALTCIVLSAYACSDGANPKDADSKSDSGSSDGARDSGSPPFPEGTDSSPPSLVDGAAADATPDNSRDAAMEAGPPPGPLSAQYVNYDINHVLVAGQSNSVANGATPPISVSQPFGNLMFNTGVMPMGSCDGNGCTVYQTPTSFEPLVDGDKFFDYGVETPSSGIGNEISFLAAQKFEFGMRASYPAKHDVLVSVHGRSGNTYWCLRKGGCSYILGSGKNSPFAQAIQEVQSAKELAVAQGKTYGVRAVSVLHGESDHYAYNDNRSEFPLIGTDGTPGKVRDYSDALLEWQQDYEASIKAITGQTTKIPLLVSGLSGWLTSRESRLANMQLDAHIRSSGKVVLVAPGYAFAFANDCLHYSNHGSRRLGEYFAKVYARIVFGGETWEPVRPRDLSRVGNVISIRFHVPKPPLALDTTQVAAIANMGFSVSENGVEAAITNVAIVAQDRIEVTLAAVPAGTSLRVKYAQNQNTGPNRCTGPQSGARGNVRDSDDWPSYYTDGPPGTGTPYPLQNWAVNFDLPVP